ncbi:hypothetical protein V1291_001824 [Nitrobacteraceae bacterium AZCC 1564]
MSVIEPDQDSVPHHQDGPGLSHMDHMQRPQNAIELQTFQKTLRSRLGTLEEGTGIKSRAS